MTGISEADWEIAALDTLAEPLGWRAEARRGDRARHGRARDVG